MKKLAKILGDVAVTVGCCVGVGFLSGKEAQFFWGNDASIALFTAVFALTTFLIREYCRTTQFATVGEMSKMFKRGAGIWEWAIAFCSFVCSVTVLAGAEQCLAQLLGALPLPVFAFVAAACAGILSRASIKTLKIVNTLALLLAAALLIALFAEGKASQGNSTVPPWRPAVYALFSVTMTLGVSARLGKDCSQRENAVVSVVSAGLVAMLMFAVLPLCNFDAELPTLDKLGLPMRLFAALALLLSSVTGLAVNVLPVSELLTSVIPDKTLCIVLIFGLALALSMFGFDFALRFGYAAVAAVGAATVFTATKKLTTNNAVSKKTKVYSDTAR